MHPQRYKVLYLGPRHLPHRLEIWLYQLRYYLGPIQSSWLKHSRLALISS
ncbi:Uncharacterised protein [Vibrio cholerae]|nr:Uncharacterised protein [Vibrio cholerae]